MKKYLHSLMILLSVATFLKAQNLTQAENYVYSRTYLEPVTASSSGAKQTQAVTYIDGLGRPKQNISIKTTPSGKDIVTPMEYDTIGRQVRNILPLPQQGTSNGDIFSSPDMTGAVSVYGNASNYYSEKKIENSPLDRLLEDAAPGDPWKMGTGKTVKYTHQSNIDSEVKKFIVVTSWSTVSNVSVGIPMLSISTENTEYVSAGFYKKGTLYKNTVTDEDGNIVTKFTNTKGQDLLIRRNDGTQNIDTYYAYNEYGQLAFVIPPLAAKSIEAAGNTIPATVLYNLCYQYHYDNQNRMVEKKLPGKDWELMVYDQQDRLVLMQDGNLRTMGNNFGVKGWMFTKYDKLGRIVYTGFFANTATRPVMQNALNSMAANAGNNEEPSSTPIVQDGMNIYYTKKAFPTGSMTILSVKYYDENPPGAPENPGVVLGQPTLTSNPMLISVNNIRTTRSTRGLLTASHVRNINDFNWTRDYFWYDRKGREIGTNSINHLGGYTRTESKLDFAGVPKTVVTKHKRLGTDTERVITETFDYDNQNRLLVHRHQVDSNPVEILTQNKYNELSQLESKKVGGTDIANTLQSIDYKYNIRGWLTKINDPTTLNGKLFGYEIRYNNPVYTNLSSGRYNGNIAEVDWKNSSENTLKRYSYVYDNLNRLKDAAYAEPESTNPYNNNFNENLSYDLNGNILTLKRNAFPVSGTTATQVDDLEYKYTGNRLNQIIEHSTNSSGYEGGDNIIDYDLNGNMINMKDKGIKAISYNFLNLPNSIGIQHVNPVGNISTTDISHLYRADGVKLRKIFTQQAYRGLPTIRMTDYLDGFQYSYIEDGSICPTCRTESAYEIQAYSKAIGPIISKPTWKLDFVPTSEGFYSFTENRYIYQYKDHLGNTRISFAKNSAGALQVMDTNNYYPFGLNHIGGSTYSNIGSYYNYKYQGQELQETGWYSFKWRNYMPDVGRFFNIDPLSEKYAYQSHYNFSENRVIDARELEGLEAELINKSTVSTPVSNDISGYSLNTSAKIQLTANVVQGSFTNEQVKQKLSTVESNFKKDGVNLSIVQDKNATYKIDMTFQGKSVTVVNNNGTTTTGTVLGDAPLGNPITATVNAKNGNTDTITHEIGHTFGLPHIWESNSGVDNTPANINNRMNSYENPTSSMKGLGTEFNKNQIQKMEETVKANSFRLHQNKK